MMGVRMPETCWAVFKWQVINLRSCCIWLVDLFESIMVHGLANPKSSFIVFDAWLYYEFEGISYSFGFNSTFCPCVAGTRIEQLQIWCRSNKNDISNIQICGLTPFFSGPARYFVPSPSCHGNYGSEHGSLLLPESTFVQNRNKEQPAFLVHFTVLFLTALWPVDWFPHALFLFRMTC
jgi:hypothetical protein